MINKELKKAIINWLLENENAWQRTNACMKNFSEYIFNKDGNYLIGGEDVLNFIEKIEKAIYFN